VDSKYRIIANHDKRQRIEPIELGELVVAPDGSQPPERLRSMTLLASLLVPASKVIAQGWSGDRVSILGMDEEGYEEARGYTDITPHIRKEVMRYLSIDDRQVIRVCWDCVQKYNVPGLLSVATISTEAMGSCGHCGKEVPNDMLQHVWSDWLQPEPVEGGDVVKALEHLKDAADLLKLNDKERAILSSLAEKRMGQ